MKIFMMAIIALFVVNTAVASQMADKNTFECVEVIKDLSKPQCKALTFGCIGGFALKVNGEMVTGFAKSPFAEGECTEAMALAKEVVDNKELMQEALLNEWLVKKTLELAK